MRSRCLAMAALVLVIVDPVVEAKRPPGPRPTNEMERRTLEDAEKLHEKGTGLMIPGIIVTGVGVLWMVLSAADIYAGKDDFAWVFTLPVAAAHLAVGIPLAAVGGYKRAQADDMRARIGVMPIMGGPRQAGATLGLHLTF